MTPAEGVTVPSYPKDPAYSWIKAPRYKQRAHETGPLARMKLNGLYLGSISVMDRILARAQEAAMLVDRLSDGIAQLVPGGDTYVGLHPPASGVGVGLTEAPRGALGRWLQYASGKITRYQMVTPTCWNATPRRSTTAAIRVPWSTRSWGRASPTSRSPSSCSGSCIRSTRA